MLIFSKVIDNFWYCYVIFEVVVKIDIEVFFLKLKFKKQVLKKEMKVKGVKGGVVFGNDFVVVVNGVVNGFKWKCKKGLSLGGKKFQVIFEQLK